MRRILLLIGLVLFPQIAGATPLSPWVDGVLKQIDAGIAAVPSGGGSCDNNALMGEIRKNLSVVRDERTLLLELGIESQFLRERTLCFESDRLLLQSKLNDVYAAFNTATTACNIDASTRLRSIYEYAVTAYRAFLKGSIDPSFQDNRLRLKDPFGGTEVDPDSTAPLCPYTTDYAPHFIGALPNSSGNSYDIKSYGCDADMLAFVRDGLPPLPPKLQMEAGDLIYFMDQSGSLASDIFTLVRDAIFNIDSTIALLTGAVPPDPPGSPATPPPHAEQEGCLRPKSPESGSAAAFDTVLAAFPDFFDPSFLQNPGSSSATFDPPLAQMLPFGTLFRPSYDSFFTLPNALILSRAHADRKSQIGANRPLPDDLQIQGDEQQYYFMYKLDTSKEFSDTSEDTERFMSMSDAILRDSYERNLESVVSLDSAIRTLSSITENFLPKEYIPRLVYFLRRSCVDGHCNSLLDAVAKRSFNKYCHPYVSGLYTDEKASDKCFCTSEFDGEDYCSGGDLHLSDQPPAQLQCGEPLASSSASSTPGGLLRLFTF